MKTALLHLLSPLFFVAGVYADPSSPLASLQAELKSHGPKAAIMKMGATEALETAAMNGIAAADDDWLKLTDSLILFSDAAISEGFSISLGEALGKNPEKVFKLMPKLKSNHHRLENACHSLPICEDSSCHQDSVDFAKRRVDALSKLQAQHPSKEVLFCQTTAEKVVKAIAAPVE